MARSYALTRAPRAFPTALAARSAWQVGKYAAKKAQQYRQRSQRRSFIEPSAITTQHDSSTRYRRKRMPRRRRKQWVSFTKRVQHVMLQSQPLQSYCIDDIGGTKTVAIDTQVTDGQMLGGTQATNNDELFKIFQAAYGGGLTTSTVDKYKLFVKSMCLDVQLTNIHATKACVVDVYTLLARKSINTATRIDVQYTNAFAEQGALSIGTVSSANVASTVFQNGPFLEMWKVLDKREILLGVGQTTTLQLRIPYNRYVSGKQIEINSSMIPGFTRAFLFQMRGVPEDNAGTPRLAATQVAWKGQCTVVYGVPPSSTISDATAEV